MASTDEAGAAPSPEPAIQLVARRTPEGEIVIEGRQQAMAPERARLLWQELADYAQRRALSEEARRRAQVELDPPRGPLPVVLPPDLQPLRRRAAVAAGAGVEPARPAPGGDGGPERRRAGSTPPGGWPSARR